MSQILVTGANGFLGSWLIRALNEIGQTPKALVRKNSDLSELEGLNFEIVYGDVTNFQSLQMACENIETVFHLAGLIAYKKSDREKMELVNVLGTKNMIEAALDRHVKRFVHLSSVVAIGAGLTEEQVLNEESKFNISDLDLGYFETKRKAESLVMTAVRERGLDAVILNPSTIYGPGDARKGSRKNQIKVAQGKLPFYTPGGVNVVAVQDAVEGILSAWKIGKTGERYILAGENITIKTLFQVIAETAGQKAPHFLLPRWFLMLMGKWGDLKARMGFSSSFSLENAWTSTLYHWFDSSKAQKELNFKPRPARQAIEQSVNWMKENDYI